MYYPSYMVDPHVTISAKENGFKCVKCDTAPIHAINIPNIHDNIILCFSVDQVQSIYQLGL